MNVRVYTLPTDSEIRSNAHRIMIEDIRDREGSIASYYRREKRGAQEMESDNEEETETKDRSSRIRS